MSTVLLMSDSWQPTVLRLVPFSNNNAKPYERKQNGRHQNVRGFPVLAVTRGAKKINSASTDSRSARSASSRSLRSAHSDYPMDNVSEVSAYTTPMRTSRDDSDEQVSKHKKYPQKKVPVMHSEMKEAIRFSVQDLNDQVSSSASLHSAEEQESKEKSNKADNTRTALPKPSLCPSGEAKQVTPINGLRRSVPLTPGEMELQRIRDNYVIEQAQKKKKYKVNVNQIPRSTTPINDHDPDKLNMKQVIAFLQTKTGKDSNHKKSATEKRIESNKVIAPSRKGSEVSVVSIRQRPAQESEPSYGMVSSETRYVDKMEHYRYVDNTDNYRYVDKWDDYRNGNKTDTYGRTDRTASYKNVDKTDHSRSVDKTNQHGYVNIVRNSRSDKTDNSKYVDKTDNTRDLNGCVSVLSTKSTPNLRYGQHTSSSNRTAGATSVRSFGHRSRDARTSRSKPVKEFKLYRFLAVAQEGEQRQGLITTVEDSVPNVDLTTFSYRSQKNHSPDSPKKFLRKKHRDTTTANLIHRRVVNRHGPPVMAYAGNRESQDAPTIRLPSMDNSPEHDDDDDDSCSTTSATYNSTKNGSVNEKVVKVTKKEKSISFSDEKPTDEKPVPKEEITENPVSKVEIKEIKRETHEDENNNSVTGRLLVNFQTKTFKSPEFPRVSINGPKQIHVNMPQENKKGYSQEIVRLTLRQDKSATRVTSYMSDLQSNSPSKWHEMDRFESLDTTVPESRREWESNTPRQMANTVANNNFIKVRQKLKSSNLST